MQRASLNWSPRGVRTPGDPEQTTTPSTGVRTGTVWGSSSSCATAVVLFTQNVTPHGRVRYAPTSRCA
jgi:hypothetical protein